MTATSAALNAARRTEQQARRHVMTMRAKAVKANALALERARNLISGWASIERMFDLAGATTLPHNRAMFLDRAKRLLREAQVWRIGGEIAARLP